MIFIVSDPEDQRFGLIDAASREAAKQKYLVDYCGLDKDEVALEEVTGISCTPLDDILEGLKHMDFYEIV